MHLNDLETIPPPPQSVEKLSSMKLVPVPERLGTAPLGYSDKTLTCLIWPILNSNFCLLRTERLQRTPF